MENIWGFHTPINNEESIIKNKIIAIGWDELGDLSKIKQENNEYKKKYKNIYPEKTKQSIATSAGELYRFVNELKIGDYVVFPTKSDERLIYIGKIIGDYYFDNSTEKYKNRRKVEWIKELPRTEFSQGALYESGSFLTLFKIKHYADEYINAITNKKIKKDIDVEESIITSNSIIELTKDYVLKKLKEIYKGYDLENVVADLLNAMGYKTKISNHGGDNGIDIIAYKDELPPRIIVQVKSQSGKITEQLVQSLKGTMEEGDYGVFVTLSDYTANAKKYLEKHSIIKSINGSELVDLILKYYDSMPDDFKDNIKLTKVFLPVIKDEE